MMRRRPLRRVGRTAVVAGTAAAVAGGVSRRRNAKTQGSQSSAPPAQEKDPSDAPPVPGSKEAIDQLKELGALKDQGILTDEEFAAQKAKLLG